MGEYILWLLQTMNQKALIKKSLAKSKPDDLSPSCFIRQRDMFRDLRSARNNKTAESNKVCLGVDQGISE